MEEVGKRIKAIMAYYNIKYVKDFAANTGRHTFATTIAMQNGIPIEVISRMLGHSDIRTTQIYAKVQRSMVEEQGKIIAQKLAL